MFYRDLNTYLRERFGCKVYKLALDSGATCPNRDGTCGTRGCIFCDGGGAFAAQGESMAQQLEAARARVRGKVPAGTKYIAYFQSYSATWAPLPQLRERFSAALAVPDVVALSVATRPDCLGAPVLALLAELNRYKPVWVELGLQTIHPQSAAWIRRGYELPVYDDAVRRLRAVGLEVIVHLILGLPGETPEMMEASAAYVGRSGVQGVKLHCLHVLRGTDLETEWLAGQVPLPELDEYIDWLERCLRRLPPEIVIHRLTGDGDKRTLLAPLWSADKKHVLAALRAAFRRDDLVQGSAWVD